MRVALAVCLALATVSPAMAIDVYLNDLLNRPSYRALYAKMLASEGQPPAWLRLKPRSRETLEFPGFDVKVGNLTYFVAPACWKPFCSENAILAIFDPNEQKTVARLTIDGKTRWIGNPASDLKQAVQTESEKHL